MFQVPQWEDDVPKRADTFKKKAKNKKKKSLDKLIFKNTNVSQHSEQNENIDNTKVTTNTFKKLKKDKNVQKSQCILNGTNNVRKITGFDTKGKKEIVKDENRNKIRIEKKNEEIYNNKMEEQKFSPGRNVIKAPLNKKKKKNKLANTQKRSLKFKEISKQNNSSKEISINKLVSDANDSQESNQTPYIYPNEEANIVESKLESSLENNLNKIGRKRKNKNKIKSRKQVNIDATNIEEHNYDSEVLDEEMLNAKKKKLAETFEEEKQEHLLFKESSKNRDILQNKPINKTAGISVIKNDVSNTNLYRFSKINKKKEKIKKLLETQSNRNTINVCGNNLRTRMLERLKAAQFRYLNEKLYTSSGSDAQKLFQSDPIAFQTYHEGYQQQLKKWPVNPLDVIVKKIQKMPKSYSIADMGCGEAALSKRISHTVRSFDLVATAPGVEECDMAHTPLLAASMDVAVYCLALMGTDLTQYLVEANRILKMSGHLLIAEVESRFEKVEDFIKDVERLGFKLKKLDKSNEVFFFMEFTKIRDPPVKKNKLPKLTLKPCLYKKR